LAPNSSERGNNLPAAYQVGRKPAEAKDLKVELSGTLHLFVSSAAEVLKLG